MPSPNDKPELIDFNSPNPKDTRQFMGFLPFTAGALIGSALLGNNFNGYCYPASYHYHWRDYYTCSPKYVCKPVPYYP